MKTIRYHLAGWMLAALATVMVAGSLRAEEAGVARLSDFETPTTSAHTQDDLVIRGASDYRRRNAQTAQALRQLLGINPASTQRPMRRDAQVRPAGQLHQASALQPANCEVPSAMSCCPGDGCCPDMGCCPTCAAPADCCPPAPECCAPGACCPPAPECCAPNACCPPMGDCCAPPCDGCCPGDACCPDSCDGCTAAGRYRISDSCFHCGGKGCAKCRKPSDRGNVRLTGGWGNGECEHGHAAGGCRICNQGSCMNRNCVAGFLSEQAAAHRARNRMASANVNQYLRCKLGYFINDGNGGIGTPMFGHYSLVYPVDPYYADGRDGQVYAAEGYGGAVSVPLAPTVSHTYNYGWGVPSSRLTPVSNVAP